MNDTNNHSNACVIIIRKSYDTIDYVTWVLRALNSTRRGSHLGERLSCARSALGRGGAGGPHRATKFFGVFSPPKSGVQVATARAGDLRRAMAGPKHWEMRPFAVVWQMSLLRAWSFFLLFRVVLGHFFWLFPSVPNIVTPKMPGVVIIKGPVTARKKKFMSPGP
jgi:hypothetical protein